MVIFYGVCGEGMGHCSRAHAVMERFPEHEFHVFTWGTGLSYFRDIGHPGIFPTAAIPFGRKNGRISWPGTLWNFLRFLYRFPSSIAAIATADADLHPDVYITDFEPTIAWAALIRNKRLISIDNQHRFSRCVIKDLPFLLRWHAKFVGAFTELWIPAPSQCVVATFHTSTPRRPNTLVITPLMRRLLTDLTPTRGDFVLVYHKDGMGTKVLDTLAHFPVHLRVYNTHDRRFPCYRADPERFVVDLAGCKAVIASGGNQLICEARYFGKPILVIPEPNQSEQALNAFYVNQYDGCMACTLDEFNKEILGAFLAGL